MNLLSELNSLSCTTQIYQNVSFFNLSQVCLLLLKPSEAVSRENQGISVKMLAKF